MSDSRIDPEVRVELFPTCGHWDHVGRAWRIPVHAWAFRPPREGLALKAARGIFRRAAGLKGKHEEAETFHDRTWRFLVDNLPGKELIVQVAGREHRLPPTGANGHSRHTLSVPATEVGDATCVAIRLMQPAEDAGECAGSAHLPSPAGLSVISDIDDTIKISEVGHRRRLMKNTFVLPFQPVPGMAALYARLAAAGATFHYVTSAPWQLCHALTTFLAEFGFPVGSMHMKKLRWKDRSFLELFSSPTRFKPQQIEPLLAAFPQRQFAFIGDSGEKDPEIYASLAARHPAQVRAACIRNVTGEDAGSKRMRKAFRDVPQSAVQVFVTPDEIDLPRIFD